MLILFLFLFALEKFYKKYNALKKELKQETERLKTESPLANSPPRSSQTSPTTTRSVIGTNSRRNSVEFVRSPSHPMSRRRPSIFDSSSSSQQTVRRLSEFEEMKSALASVSSSSQTSALNSSQQQRTLTEDEAFWLDIPSTPSTTTSYSQPIPSSTSSSSTTSTTTAAAFQFSTASSNSQQEGKPKKKRQLVLGGGSSQPIISTKRTLKQLKLFGMTQNPFQRAINSPQLSPTSIEASSPGSSTSSPRPPLTSTTTKSIVEAEYEEDDEDEQIEIVNHEFDPFKNYDPSLFHWQDPSFSIGPGFFSQVTSSIPILNDPKRRSRVLYKLEKGTLGEVHEENKRMEEEISEDLRAFIAANSQLDVSFFLL